MNKPDDGLKDELRDLSPLLSNFWEDRGKILPPPPQYFDNLPEEIMAKIRAQAAATSPNSHSKTKIWPLGKRARPAAQILLVAASFALLVATGIKAFLSPDNSLNTCADINCLKSAEVEEYVQGNLHEFTLDLILETEGTVGTLQGLALPVPIHTKEDNIDPILLDALQHLNNQEIESLF